MRKRALALFAVLGVSAIFVLPVSAEMAKEGSSTGTLSFTGTFTVLRMGQERLQMNYEAFGVARSDSEDAPLHNASVYCLGSLHASKGVIEESGFCEYTRPDGDKVYLAYQGKGRVGVGVTGTGTLVGGTGKCEGIQGSSEFTRQSLRPPAEGHFASFNVTKLSWKIP